MPPLSPFTLRRIQKLPKTNSVWEGGVCSMPDGQQEDQNCILWIDGHHGHVRSVDMVALDSGYEAVARSSKFMQACSLPERSRLRVLLKGQFEEWRALKHCVAFRELASPFLVF